MPGLDQLYVSWFARRFFDGVTDDEPIWNQADPSFRGAMVEEDALQLRFRRYYRRHLHEPEAVTSRGARARA